MAASKHLLMALPEDWTNNQTGEFYEKFISNIIEPLRFQVINRIRFTGMEIDLLAKGIDQPTTVLIECKASKDPISAEAISKLIGNVALRKASQGWLFTVSDLTKDGRGQMEDIQADADLSQKITWYSPERTIDVLISHGRIVTTDSLSHYFHGERIDDWTLVVTETGLYWLAQIIEGGLPLSFCVFSAADGEPLPETQAIGICRRDKRLSALKYHSLQSKVPPVVTGKKAERVTVARVLPGDTWSDLRPSRPKDFIGREGLIDELEDFIEAARKNQTTTRTFALQAPSGWGKSSLIIKLSHSLGRGINKKISATAVDTRSAASSGFVGEAIRLALTDAKERGLIPSTLNCDIAGLRYPLDSPGVLEALEYCRQNGCVIVLVFDQFEELFYKENLFETFEAVGELSLDLDSKQLPLVLGFAWKTDVALPQQHPAYHLWHELSDRRRTFKVPQFGSSEIKRLITRAEKDASTKLNHAVRVRLIEQCQGFPWLLKKLLVHILQRVNTADSQYQLLERQLDVELLFKEDLAQLKDEHIRCLKYVAQEGPIAVTEVEKNFHASVTNYLLQSHLFIRSGLNYVIYWDIFRDYLIEGTVPSIPWARTFQQGPRAALRVLAILQGTDGLTLPRLAEQFQSKEGVCANITADLVALQLVEVDVNSVYRIAMHVAEASTLDVATHVYNELSRHVLVKRMKNQFPMDHSFSKEEWDNFFESIAPRSSSYSKKTIHQYANNIRRWLVFAGILKDGPNPTIDSSLVGPQLDIVEAFVSLGSRRAGRFLGTSSPQRLVELIALLRGDGQKTKPYLESLGLRNAICDAQALKILKIDSAKNVELTLIYPDIEDCIDEIKRIVLGQPAVKIIEEASVVDRTNPEYLPASLQQMIGAKLKIGSARRYAGGIRRFYEWATGVGATPDLSLESQKSSIGT